MDARKEALAYRIWAMAREEGWNISTQELAKRLDASAGAVVQVCKERGWMDRLRTGRTICVGYPPYAVFGFGGFDFPKVQHVAE